MDSGDDNTDDIPSPVTLSYNITAIHTSSTASTRTASPIPLLTPSAIGVVPHFDYPSPLQPPSYSVLPKASKRRLSYAPFPFKSTPKYLSYILFFIACLFLLALLQFIFYILLHLLD